MMLKSEQLESQSTTTSTQKHSSKPKKFCRFLKYSSMKFDLFFIKFWKSLWTLSVLLDNHNNNNEDNNHDNIDGNERNYDNQTSDINIDTNDSVDDIDGNSVMNNNGSNFNGINDCEGDFDPDLTLTQSYNSTLISPKIESNSRSHNTLSVLSDLDSDIGNSNNDSDGYNGDRLVLTRTPAIAVTPMAPGAGAGTGLGLGLIPMDDDMDMDMDVCGLVPPMIGVNLQVYDSHADDNDNDFDNNNNGYEYDYDSDYYYNLQMCNDNDVIHNSDSDMGIHYLSDYTSSDDSSDDDSDLYGLHIGFPETPKYFDYCNETSNWKPKWLRNRDDSDEYFSSSDSITLTVSVTMSTNDDKLNVKDRISDSPSQSNIIFNHSDVMITENNDSGDYDNNDNDNDNGSDDDSVSESSTPTYNRSYV